MSKPPSPAPIQSDAEESDEEEWETETETETEETESEMTDSAASVRPCWRGMRSVCGHCRAHCFCGADVGLLWLAGSHNEGAAADCAANAASCCGRHGQQDAALHAHAAAAGSVRTVPNLPCRRLSGDHDFNRSLSCS